MSPKSRGRRAAQRHLHAVQSAHDTNRARTALAQLDPAVARDAEVALDWLVPEDGDIDDLSQLGLEEFLWYHLPVKWAVDTPTLHSIAWALGEFFELAGKQRYAGLCRGHDTHVLLDSWQVDEIAARRQMRKLIDQSGVHPVDTEVVTWGAVMGPMEFDANRNSSLALEGAIDDGALIPGARGWRAAAARIVDASVSQPGPDARGIVLDGILRERADSWSAGGSARRTRLLRRLIPDLLTRLEPGDAVESVEPMAWLLSEIGDGIRLTPGGRLPRSLLRRADDRYHWFEHHGYGSIRVEEDLQEVRSMHDLGRKSRLLTFRNGRLSLSAAGRKALAQPGLLWEAVIAGLFDSSTPLGDASAIWSALLLAETETAARERDARDQTEAMLRECWHPTSGGALGPYGLSWATWDFAALAPAFGWVAVSGGFMARKWTLTPHGQAAVRAGLHHQATAPRLRP